MDCYAGHAGVLGSVNRRDFLRVLVIGSIGSVLTACSAPAPPAAAPPAATTAPPPKPTAPAPAAAPTTAPAVVATTAPAVVKPAAAPGGLASADWDKVLADAKKEGKVTIAGPQPDVYKTAFLKFNGAYPEIVVEYTAGGGRDHFPKIQAERQAGQFNWDLLVGGSGTMFRQFVPGGFLDPILPALRTDLIDDKNWIGGFAAGWQDKTRQFSYAFEGTVAPAVYANRDVAPESQVSKLDQLLDPQWKGKIAWDDPRAAGAGSGVAGHLYALKGKDYVTKLYQQEPVITTDNRQLVEWVVRGTYPFGIGIQPAGLAPFLAQGLGQNVKGVEMDGAGARMGSSWGCLGLISKAPHPNAQKVFANWLLSKEGQTVWVQATNSDNSRRTDVDGPKETAPSATAKWSDDEPNGAAQDNAVALAKELIH